jgi:phosphotriesterase-related protein
MKGELSRRAFIIKGAACFLLIRSNPLPYINTVKGPVNAASMGTSLIHEHFLVDFIGADQINSNRWKREEVIKKALPYILEAKKHGVKTIFDCTPAFLGRDIALLKRLSEISGLHIITNTGYYGAVGNKYLPAHAFTETDKELANRWISEFENGIEDTGIKPGFIKIGVDSGSLSEVHKKLVRAAGLTHLQTGLTICAHTGPAVPALEEIGLLQTMGVHPSAFVWTHAQAEKDKSLHIKAAARGAWISLDGIAWGDKEDYADSIQSIKRAGFLHKLLLSHDAGWYKPGEKEGGSFKGYTTIFNELFPLLSKRGFTKKDFKLLLQTNPVEAFAIKRRKQQLGSGI